MQCNKQLFKCLKLIKSMGFIRTSLITIISILLLASLFFGNLFLTFSYSLDYENIEPEMSKVVQEVIYDSSLAKIQNTSLGDISNYCNSHKNFPLKTEKGTYTVPCKTIETSSKNVKNFIFQNISKGKLKEHSKKNIERQIENSYNYMLDYCVEKEEINQKLAGKEITIPCNMSGKNKEKSLVEHIIESKAKEYYFKQYDCNFVDCFENKGIPFFLVSEKAQNYWKNLFWKTVLISAILFLILIVLVVKKTNTLLILGISIIFSTPLFISPHLLSGLIFKIGLFLFSLFASANFSSSLDLASNNLISIGEIFLSKSTKVFIKMLITGIIILLTGIILKILEKSYNISGKIKEFIKRS